MTQPAATFDPAAVCEPAAFGEPTAFGEPAALAEPAALGEPAAINESEASPVSAADAAQGHEADVEAWAITAALEGLKAELSRYRGEITTLDARLRDCSLAPDAPLIRSCAEDLRKANTLYLEQHEAHRDRFAPEAVGNPAASAVRELAGAADRQAAVVAAAQVELSDLAVETDLLVQCRQMLDETRQISETSDELQATIGNALRAIAPGAAISSASEKLAANAAERREFAGRIADWWQAQPARDGKPSVAMIDPDDLGRANEQYGRVAINRALPILDRIINRNLPQGQTAARGTGPSYLLLLPDCSPREAVALVERCRQEIDATEFQHGDAAFRLTVSCAVGQTDYAEDAAALVARLEAMLNEAKRYGRNRTFFQDGSYPSPAVPPALAIEGQTVRLEA